MGVDTKGFVTTKCQDVFFVVHLVEEALNKLIRPHAREERFAQRGADEPRKYSMVDPRLHASSEGVNLCFTYAGESRQLHMYFGVGDDSEEMGPKRILMSLGCWGESELYMKTALKALSPLGDVYYDYSDCDDIEPAELDIAPLNFLTACAAGIESDFPTNLARWKTLFDAGLLRAATCEEVLGMPVAEVERLTSIHWEEAQTELKAMVKAIASSTATPTADVPT